MIVLVMPVYIKMESTKFRSDNEFRSLTAEYNGYYCLVIKYVNELIRSAFALAGLKMNFFASLGFT